ncbi:MAG TPA: hypothetical protein DDX54_06970 [Rhodospirillaceae bacterium]|nr:hypothetical protein [Rhodospirillaceae bacterium]
MHERFVPRPLLCQGGVGGATRAEKGGDIMAKIGRDARNGQFIPVKTAERRKSTAIVETVKNKKGKGCK